MGNKNELLQKIDEKYSKFSKGQKKLADFIREDYDKAAFLTAAKMGRKSVSASQQLCVLRWRLDTKDTRASRRH